MSTHPPHTIVIMASPGREDLDIAQNYRGVIQGDLSPKYFLLSFFSPQILPNSSFSSQRGGGGQAGLKCPVLKVH